MFLVSSQAARCSRLPSRDLGARDAVCDSGNGSFPVCVDRCAAEQVGGQVMRAADDHLKLSFVSKEGESAWQSIATPQSVATAVNEPVMFVTAGEVFCETPHIPLKEIDKTKPMSAFIEKVVDSSRYFVVGVQVQFASAFLLLVCGVHASRCVRRARCSGAQEQASVPAGYGIQGEEHRVRLQRCAYASCISRCFGVLKNLLCDAQ